MAREKEPVAHKLAEFILVDETTRKVSFPTMGFCAACGGYRSAIHRSRATDDPEMAFLIALVRHGYYMANWEGERIANATIFPERCTCECEHLWGKKQLRNCLALWTCERCGVQLQIDSSD